MSDNPFAAPEDLAAQASAATAVPSAARAVATPAVPPALPVPDAVVASSAQGTDTFVISEPFPAPASATREPKQKAGLGGGAIAAIAAGALVLGAIGGFGGAYAYDQFTEDSAVRQTPTTLPVSHDDDSSKQLQDGSVASIAAAVLPSVVSIEASSGAGRTSTGSGFVVREDGYIATNNHVVAGADGGTIKVLFSDGSIVDAELVGRTADYDIAVLKVDKAGLKPLVLGDSDAMVVGDPVLAVGSPLGLDSTVTTGIISALHRPVTTGTEDQEAATFIDAIQTDAAINPGNSGGPLINSAGEVIGINSAIASTNSFGGQAGSVGLGFAIPSNQVRRTVEEIIDTGKATYPVIGVLLDPTHTGEGVLIATEVEGAPGVVAGGPADQAGIKPGDIITAFNGRTIARSDDLIVAIRAKAPGETVTLTVKRDGTTQDIDVVLSANTKVNFEDDDLEPETQPSP